MATGDQRSVMRKVLKAFAASGIAVWSVAKDAVMSLPLFVSALFGVGWPIRGTDADPDPPKPRNPESPVRSAQNDSAAEPNPDAAAVSPEKPRQDADATNSR